MGTKMAVAFANIWPILKQKSDKSKQNKTNRMETFY